MTLIIGARCKDGVVLISDKRAVEGNEITSTEDVLSLYNDLQSADSVSFQILRRGREYDIDLNIK